ncbi:MAG: histidinol-phosphate transaminase [Spirosomataceae bacterium]
MKNLSAPSRLHFNEMPFDLPIHLKERVLNRMLNMPWNQYPDNSNLTSLLADYYKVTPENILLSNGSSVLIQLIIRCFSKVFSHAIMESPAFGLYEQCCQQEQLPYQTWQLTHDFKYNLSTFPKHHEPTLVLLSSPNNPTGAVLDTASLKTLLERNPTSLFVIDEAYAEFEGTSAVPLTKQYSNLLVLKTFSKAFGLPSIRFGYVIGQMAPLALIRKHILPFNINLFTQVAAEEVLSIPAIMAQVSFNQMKLRQIRDTFYRTICQQGSSFVETGTPTANFLFIRFHHAQYLPLLQKVFQQNGILIADWSQQCKGCLRISIGTAQEMQQVTDLLLAHFELLNQTVIEQALAA